MNDLSGSDPPVVLSFEHVRTRFSNERVLDDVSFEIRRGELVCLLGPTGCGKSTALRIIGHLLDQYDGTVRVDGRSPAAAWSKLAYVFQSPRLVHWRTALDNVLLGMELRFDDLSTAARRERALDGLRMVGLERDAAKYPVVLSGGERQRVSIARALAVEPEIILMDEPLSSLDVTTKQRLRDEILRIWQATGRTVVFVTHDLDEALYLADRVILFSGKPTRVLRTFDLPQPRPRAVEVDPALLALKGELRGLFGRQADPGESRP